MVFQLGMMLASFGMCLIVFQHSIAHMIIHWHIDMGHLLYFYIRIAV